MIPVIILGLMIIEGCLPNDKEAATDVYFDYKITGEEGKPGVNCLFQFLAGRRNNRAVHLMQPATIKLDSIELTVDSAKLSGAFYEKIFPLDSFAGPHEILYTDVNRKKYKEEFFFTVFHLANELPAAVDPANDLFIRLAGLKELDSLRVVATDTSFESLGINEVLPVHKGELNIAAKFFGQLVDGPIILLLYHETERPVKEGTAKGGRISVTYSLQRQFVLKKP